MLSVFAARQKSLGNIVLTGNLTNLPQCRHIYAKLSSMFGVNYIIPENASFATVIGAALHYYITENN